MIPKINLYNLTREAAQGVSIPYVPVVAGDELHVEDGEPSSSLWNGTALLEAGKELEFVEILENKLVFTRFKSGESYVAAGFSIGPITSDRMRCFAEFLAHAVGLTGHSDEVEAIASILLDAHGPDYVGYVPIDPLGPMDTELDSPRLYKEP